jgi:histidinol dehydrogenase
MGAVTPVGVGVGMYWDNLTAGKCGIDRISSFDASGLAVQIAAEVADFNPEDYLPYVRNAGSVFMGKFCPESLGDYIAGPNHTLPTSGTARFSSPLSVDDFIKKTQYTYFTKEALAELAQDIAVFARAEGLEAHARAALIRME